MASKLGIAAIELAAIALVISLGCAPAVDGPIDHQRAIDRDDGDRLAAQLAQLPGVAAASVVLHHARRDPLGATAPAAAMLTAVIAIDERSESGERGPAGFAGGEGAPPLSINERSESGERGPAGFAGGEGAPPPSIDDRAAPEEIRAAAVRLARATLPELPPSELAIEIAAAVHRPTLARVGPFTVEESSRIALKAALALGCLAIAGLAAALALRARRHRLGSSAQ